MTTDNDQTSLDDLTELRQALAHALDCDAGDGQVDAVLDALAEHEEQRAQRAAEALADQTMIRSLTAKDGGINLDLVPPHELALLWVHCARGMLGESPNYSETLVELPTASMEVKLAGEYERFALIVQRVGKLSPHQARHAAEEKAEELAHEVERLRAELATLKAPPDVHNADHMARLRRVFAETITDLADRGPEVIASQLVLYAQSAVAAVERESARIMQTAEAALELAQLPAPAPATVFLAFGGDYDAYGVRRVFAHREHADQYKRADTVEEWRVDTTPVETRTWIRALWNIRDPAAPAHLFDTINYYDPDGYSEVRDYDGNADALDIDWWPGQTTDDPWQVQISGWDRSLVDAAWKERRDRIVAAHGDLSLPLDNDKPAE
ncbi:hypothetical protein ACQP10_37980 (plasmid) [Streptosporangium sandarakinum]|uniref:hypothetical protein n=1 Tax=Streptosporangium sandarakinum TaxID=1260955 RepID=UPI003D8B529D